MSTGQHRFVESNGRFTFQPLRAEVEPAPEVALRPQATFALFTLDANSLVTSWTWGAESLFGYSRSEAVGQCIYHFLAADDAEDGRFEQELNTAYHDGKADSRHWYMCKDGVRFHGIGVVKPVWDGAGFQGYVVVVYSQKYQR